MPTITQDANTAFRDYTTTQGTAPWAPVKGDIRNLFAKVDAEIQVAATTGGTGTGDTITLTGGGLGFSFPSLAAARATSLDGGVTWFDTAGFASPGDEGHGLYVKLTADPPWATEAPVSGGAITGRNAGVPRTADGAYWMLVPDNTRVRPTQFGAQIDKEWNDYTFDQWPFFEDCKQFILNQGYGKGLIMSIPSGWFYFSQPFSIEGGGFNMEGSPGIGRTTLWINHTTYAVLIIQHEGYGYQTIDAEGGLYNGGFSGSFVGETVYVAGDTHVYVCVQAGVPSGATDGSGAWIHRPTGTGSGQVDGTVIWDYQRELRWAEKRGQGVSNPTISGISFYCQWDTTTKSNHSGVVMRSRARLENVASNGFPGCGIVIAATGNTVMRGYGNVNGWRLDRIAAYWNGIDGINIGYGDGNAGTAVDIDTAQNGRWGIANWCFLNNCFVSCQSAYDGNIGMASAQHPHQCSYNGRYYLARMPNLGYEGWPNYNSPSPDASGSWIYVGGDGTWGPSGQFPAWSPSTIFEPGGAFSSNNVNDRSTWMSLYAEGGTLPSQFASRNVVWGAIGLDAGMAYGGNIYQDGRWSQSFQRQMQALNTTTGAVKYTQMAFGGTGGSGGIYNKGIWSVYDYDNNKFELIGSNESQSGQTNWQLNLAGYTLMNHTSPSTTTQWGSGAAQPYTTQINNFVLGDTNGDGRKRWVGTGPPSSGTHARGEYVENRDFAVGQPVGWACTATGSPGTWVADRNL